MAFFEKMPYLFPHTDAKGWFDSKPEADAATPSPAQRQPAGRLPDCWRRARLAWIAGRCRASTTPRSTRRSSPARRGKSNFLVNLGYGDRVQAVPALAAPGLRRSRAHRLTPQRIHWHGSRLLPHDPPESTMFKPLILAAALLLAGTALPRTPLPRHATRSIPTTPGDRQLEPFRLLQSDRATSARSTACIVYDADNVGQSQRQGHACRWRAWTAFVPEFDEHLRSADFFDADEVPDRHLQEHQGRSRGRQQAASVHRRPDHARRDQAGRAGRDAQQGRRAADGQARAPSASTPPPRSSAANSAWTSTRPTSATR